MLLKAAWIVFWFESDGIIIVAALTLTSASGSLKMKMLYKIEDGQLHSGMEHKESYS